MKIFSIIILGLFLSACTLKYKVITPDDKVYKIETRNNTLITVVKPDGTKILVDNRWITIGIKEVKLEK